MLIDNLERKISTWMNKILSTEVLCKVLPIALRKALEQTRAIAKDSLIISGRTKNIPSRSAGA